MDWIQATIYTSSEGIEPLSGVLYQSGITGIEIEDEQDFLDFLENNKKSWDYVDDELLMEKKKETCVKIYVSDNIAGHEQLKLAKQAVLDLKARDKDNKFGRLEFSLDNVSEEDWENNWKKYFHPLKIGEKILIKPEWEELSYETDRIVFNVNPGMSFGTGSHETTKLCIEALEKIIKEGDSVLDLGCGSGILSIISMMLGAKKAYAVDIDPNAVDIAINNAKMNNIDLSSYTAKAGNILEDEALMQDIRKEKYPVVVANIVADVIIALLPFATSVLEKGGVLITSGIISDRMKDVLEAVKKEGFSKYEIYQDGDWVSIICENV